MSPFFIADCQRFDDRIKILLNSQLFIFSSYFTIRKINFESIMDLKVSLIIAFYKNIDALSLIFSALQKQSFKSFEVVVAEDDNNELSKEFIEKAQAKMPFVVKHVSQDVDDGFRKNQMLNRAINVTESDIIVFLDGDCIPHKHFIREYALNTKAGEALFGRRVMLSETFTNKLGSSKNVNLLTFSNLILSGSKKLKYGLYLPFITPYRETGIWGCNWGIYKKHLLEVNGYDEDYVRAGVGEDVDIEWRLKQTGVKLKSVRFGAIIYHMHHPENYTSDDVNANFQLFEEKKKANRFFCENGMEK